MFWTWADLGSRERRPAPVREGGPAREGCSASAGKRMRIWRGREGDEDDGTVVGEWATPIESVLAMDIVMAVDDAAELDDGVVWKCYAYIRIPVAPRRPAQFALTEYLRIDSHAT